MQTRELMANDVTVTAAGDSVIWVHRECGRTQEFLESRGSEFLRHVFDSSIFRLFDHSPFPGSVRSWKMPACRFSRNR